MFGYNGELRSATEYFKRALELADNITTDPLRVGTHNGALTVEVNAGEKTNVVVSDNSRIIISLLECDTENGVYTKPKGEPALRVTGPVTYKSREKIATMVLADAKKYVKVKIDIPDAGTATGELDIWQGYIAR